MIVQREIGGYFGLDQSLGTEYYPNALAFNTARNCLRFLIQCRDIKKIAIPDYNCDAVENAIRKEGCELYFFHVSKNLKADLSSVNDSDWIYIINYYGQNEDWIKNVINTHKNVIVDNVQAFFCKPFDGADTIYTCRKFFGVSDGAYLIPGDNTLRVRYDELKVDKSENRLSAVLGRYEDGAGDHFFEYQEIESALESVPVQKMSKITHWLLKNINYEQVISKRNENFSFLVKNLEDINELPIQKNNGPYMYPMLLNNGAFLKKKLIERKIFVSTLWPNVIESCNKNSDAFYLATNLVPIPCDQRYGVKDMAYIVEMIRQLL